MRVFWPSHGGGVSGVGDHHIISRYYNNNYFHDIYYNIHACNRLFCWCNRRYYHDIRFYYYYFLYPKKKKKLPVKISHFLNNNMLSKYNVRSRDSQLPRYIPKYVPILQLLLTFSFRWGVCAWTISRSFKKFNWS